MPRERKGVTKRKSKTDTTNCYFIIASEGADTERIYFEGLKEHLQTELLEKKQLLKIEFLSRNSETERSQSSHSKVIKQLDFYKKEYKLDNQDQLWLVIDRDKGNNKLNKIKKIAQSCIQKKYNLALSNPCFELWLLLHIKDVTEYSKETLTLLLENKKVENSSKKIIEKELSNLLEMGYNKSNYSVDIFLELIPQAIQRAEELDKNPNERWIEDHVGTRVYILMKEISKIMNSI